MTGRDDSEGYAPHPGDPWHPGWQDPSAGETDDDLFDVPEPESDEDRARFFRRLLRRDAEAEPGETAEEASSVDHLYDPIRSETEAADGDEVDAETAEEVPAGQPEMQEAPPVPEDLPAAELETDIGELEDVAVDTGELEGAAFGEGEAPSGVELDTGELEDVAVDTGELEDAAPLVAELDTGELEGAALGEGEAPSGVELEAEEPLETLEAVSFEAESVPVAQVEWDLREFEAVPTPHLEAMRQLEDALVEAELDLEDAALADELASATTGVETAERENGVASAIARERAAEADGTARAAEFLDSEIARIEAEVRATAVAAAHVAQSEIASRERERFEIDLREQQLVAVDALAAAGTHDAIERGSTFEAAIAMEITADERGLAEAETVRSRQQLIAAQSAHYADLARIGEADVRFANRDAEAHAIEDESARATAAVVAAADAHARARTVAASEALQARLADELAAEERDALEKELTDASAPADHLGADELVPDPTSAMQSQIEDDAEADVEDLAPVFATAVVVPRRRRWWQRLFRRGAEGATAAVVAAAAAEDVGITSESAAEETTDGEPTALAFAGMAADPPDQTDEGADETGELDQPVLIPAEPDAGFEGWLDPEETGPVAERDEPYAALGEEDAEAEIADWVAFTRGEEGGEEATDEIAVTDDSPEDDTEGATTEEPAEPAPEESADAATEDEAPDLAAAAAAALTDQSDTEVVDEAAIGADWDVDHFVGEEPTGERELEGEAVSISEPGEEPSEEDTGELAVIAPGVIEGDATSELEDDTGELDVVDVTDGEEFSAAASDVFDFDDFTEEDYVQTATSDHAGLAEAMAEAGDEPTEQVALAADMPGLESGVVSFDDVVESEDVYAGTAASPRSDLLVRVITAVVLIGAFAASLLWRPALIVLAIAAFLLAAGEFYTALMQKGHQPIALFGFLAIGGAGLGTVVWGIIAIPSSFLLAIAILLLFLAVAPRRRDPMLSLGLTITVAAWIGGLGSFAFDIIAAEDYRTLVLVVVVTVAIVDIAQYFVGRAIGRHRLAPVISPKKTVEGLVGGVVVAFLVGASLHFFPPFDLASGLAFGAIVAVFAPLGDLAVSAAKRALDLKDMGSILPGHGGLLDRIDSLIFVIPAAWALFTWLGYL